MDPKLNGDKVQQGDSSRERQTAQTPKGMDFTSVMKDSSQQPPADPRVALKDEIARAYDVVAGEEQDKNAKTSWTHGEHLRQLGNLDLKSGDFADSRFALDLAAQTFHNAKDKPANAERVTTDTLSELANALTRHDKKMDKEIAKGGDNNRAALIASTQLGQAKTIMDSVVERAKMEGRAPAEMIPLLQQKATTEIDLAQIAGHRTTDDTKNYLATLNAANTDLNEGLAFSAKLPNQNDAKLANARLHSELAVVGQQLNEVDRNNWYNKVWGAGLFGLGQYDVAGEYKQAVDSFNQFKPNSGTQKVEVDAEKVTTIARYLKTAPAGDANAESMQKQAEEILRQHPDWNIKL